MYLHGQLWQAQLAAEFAFFMHILHVTGDKRFRTRLHLRIFCIIIPPISLAYYTTVKV